MEGERGRPRDRNTDKDHRTSEEAEPLRHENRVMGNSVGDRGEENWASVWRHFGRNTTLHGVNKVVESREDSGGFPFRRLV